MIEGAEAEKKERKLIGKGLWVRRSAKSNEQPAILEESYVWLSRKTADLCSERREKNMQRDTREGWKRKPDISNNFLAVI